MVFGQTNTNKTDLAAQDWTTDPDALPPLIHSEHCKLPWF